MIHPPKIWLIADTHFNHLKMIELCYRPENFTELILENWRNAVGENDITFHLGDVILGRQSEMEGMIRSVKGRKILIIGNHDKEKPHWYMKRGFDFACYGIEYGHVYFTHRPSSFLPQGCTLNIHGHLHNNGHRDEDQVLNPWNKKLSIEETNYKPILLSDFR